MALIIVEGLDKSGKSTIINLLKSKYNAVLIKKQYNECLYPINFSAASVYDWQTIFDRVILSNPDTLFVADRSFFTQTMYQAIFGVNEHAITVEQASMFNNYCKVLSSMPHAIIYCHSKKYELENMVTSIAKHADLHRLFVKSFDNMPNLNILKIDMDEHTLEKRFKTIENFIHNAKIH